MKKIAKQFLVIGMTMVVLMGGVLAWSWKQLPPKLPWFYSLPWGEQQLVDKRVLAGILCGAIVWLLITRIFAVWAGKDDETVEVTIMAGGLTAIILLGATFARVLQIFVGL